MNAHSSELTAVAKGITADKLNKFYGGFHALKDFSLEVVPGEFLVLLGPSGCGKSTALRLIAGLEEPTGGTVHIDAHPPAEIRRKGDLSIAFQDPSLLPWRTVRQNIKLAQMLARRSQNQSQIDNLIQLVGLEGFGDTRPAALSGGMQQRAAIARALATEPKLLLLDEPFGAVDELTRAQLARDLAPIWEVRETTTLLVTHSVIEAVRLSDRVIVFSPRPARIIADVTVDLPRPRAHSADQTPAFNEATRAVFDALSQGAAN